MYNYNIVVAVKLAVEGDMFKVFSASQLGPDQFDPITLLNLMLNTHSSVLLQGDEFSGLYIGANCDHYSLVIFICNALLSYCHLKD